MAAGPLREWADELLEPTELAGWPVRRDGRERLWQRHCDGREDNATGLWNILMVRAWSQRWLAT